MSIFKITDGNFPPHFHTEITKSIGEVSLIRQFGHVLKVDSSSITVPYHPLSLYEAHWLKEGEIEKDTIAGSMQNITIRLGCLYEKFCATNTFVQEMGDEILEYMRNNISISMAMQENQALLNGNEDHSIQGLLENNDKICNLKGKTLHTLLMEMHARIHLYRKNALWITNTEFMSKIITTLGETHLSMLLNMNTHNCKSNSSQSILSLPVMLVEGVPEDTILLVNLENCYTFAQNGDLNLSNIPSGAFNTNYCFSVRIGGAITNPDAIVIGRLADKTEKQIGTTD